MPFILAQRVAVTSKKGLFGFDQEKNGHKKVVTWGNRSPRKWLTSLLITSKMAHFEIDHCENWSLRK